MKPKENKPFNAVFGKYSGKKLYDVYHPDFGSCCASAPGEDAAIVAAAEHWHQRWQNVEFYSRCVVTKKA